MVVDERECQCCASTFKRHKKDSASQWSRRQFCSKACANRSHAADPIHLRFWRRARQSPDGCWLWMGSKDGGGYGTISTTRGESVAKAHRISWEMRFGPVPDGYVICHKCDTPACVNPDHLFAGTQKQNMQDCSRKSRLSPVSAANLRPGRPGHLGASINPAKEKTA